MTNQAIRHAAHISITRYVDDERYRPFSLGPNLIQTQTLLQL